MVPFFATLLRFLLAFFRSLRDPEFRAMFVTVVVLLVGGTVFYSNEEGWRVVDALYFSVITLTTIGYGDLHPTTDVSKIFTIFYILVGIGVLVAFISKLSAEAIHSHQKSRKSRKRK